MTIETASGIQFMKNKGVSGPEFDLLPRKGVHKNKDVDAAKKHLHDTHHHVAEVRVTWLPSPPGRPHDYTEGPHFLSRVQNPSGGVNPIKRAVWGMFDFEDYSIRVALYDGTPDASSLLPEARIILSDGKFKYTMTGKQLFTTLSHNKLIDKTKLK